MSYLHVFVCLPVNVTALQVDLLVDGVPQLRPQTVELLSHGREQAAVYCVSHLQEGQHNIGLIKSLLYVTFIRDVGSIGALTQFMLGSRLNSWALAALKS